MLIFIPHYKITQFFVNSIILPIILATAYIFIIYKALSLNEDFSDIFSLFFSLDNLYALLSTESFLLIFWIHFVSINLFIGSWTSRDALKYNMPKKVVFLPLLLIYFSGPVGISLYWFIRIFYAKRLSFYD